MLDHSYLRLLEGKAKKKYPQFRCSIRKSGWWDSLWHWLCHIHADSPLQIPMYHGWLVVEPPLLKIWKPVGMIIPNIWKNMFQTTKQMGNVNKKTVFSIATSCPKHRSFVSPMYPEKAKWAKQPKWNGSSLIAPIWSGWDLKISSWSTARIPGKQCWNHWDTR